MNDKLTLIAKRFLDFMKGWKGWLEKIKRKKRGGNIRKTIIKIIRQPCVEKQINFEEYGIRRKNCIKINLNRVKNI